LAECRTLGGCATGDARITRGYRLPARHVIHAVGPVWHGGGYGEEAALASCYARALSLARDAGLGSIAFSAISTGVYGFPPERAAPIAVATVTDALNSPTSVVRAVFCCFSEASAELHRAALDHIAS
jgi:O-acetyl-ADP-ribose deacetylase